ncbi:hypothetical protein B0J13DRAFT_514238 [Dactylonectria estremocensis]|uniref:Uncharacterized protein n=1 Tax=Dactylonectria estremocensis TaxID=1079267 RepID=A0A9P9IE03_9HYPO|nr:hypothetical protein B0J13DRAFT_514238 [Dactylonectria estremocensis]
MRCFLGWCEFAQVNLGTRHLPAHVQYSGCNEKGRSLVLDGYESLLQTGLGGGPLSVVLGLQTNFKYTSHRRQFTPFGGFSKLLRDTALEVAAVYDAGNRRCWLVPKLSILLHMAHAYALSCADGPATTVPFVEAHSDAAELISVLEPLGDQPIHGVNRVATIGGPSPDATFLDGFVFRQLLLGLNTNLLSAVASTQKSSGKKLYGFEFMDVVKTPGRGTCMKAMTLYSVGRHWLDLVNGVDAIIMCSDIGQVITPAAAVSRRRPECNNLPTGLDYLAAMVPCLSHLVRRRGGVLEISPANANGNAPSSSSCRVKISEDSFWDLCGDPFRPCTHDMNSSETCWNRVDFLQRLVTVSFFMRNMPVAMARPESTLSSVQTIPLSGAVTFGQVQS